MVLLPEQPRDPVQPMLPFIPERVDGVRHGLIEAGQRGRALRAPVDAFAIALPPDEDGDGERVVLVQAQAHGEDVGFVMLDADSCEKLIEALRKAREHIVEMRVRE